MQYLFKRSLKIFQIKNYGRSSFLIGVFTLPSTLVFGMLFLFQASIIGSFLHKKSYFEDKWNYPFFIFGIFILINSFLQNFILPNIFSEIWDPALSFVGLFNWIPFIWFFWALQPYLDSRSNRRLFALALISGTFPVLITGFGQYFLNWTGPFETFNGLIIWFQRPIERPGGLTGLFNNQNYVGSWLNLVLPFCIALFLEKRNKIFNKTIEFIFLVSISFATFLTYSRNAWLGLLTSFPIVMGKKRIILFLPFLSIIVSVLIILLSPIFSGKIQDYLRIIISEKIFFEFSSAGYENLDFSRLDIFASALNLIQKSPIFGIGAASFSTIFFSETNSWKGHAHNLFLELSVSYGIPITVLFYATVFIILFLSGKSIFLNIKNTNISFLDRSFWAALFFFHISQLFDIQYFDGRISITSWILLSGLKSIIEETDNF